MVMVVVVVPGEYIKMEIRFQHPSSSLLMWFCGGRGDCPLHLSLGTLLEHPPGPAPLTRLSSLYLMDLV